MRTTRLLAVAAITGAVLLSPSCGFAGTWPAGSITDHSAMLTGNVGATETGALRVYFEYGTTDAYGTRTPEVLRTVTDIHVPVYASSQDWVDDLAEGTTYHYRLCAFDAGDAGGCSADATFTTTSGHDYVLGSGGIDTGSFGGYHVSVDATAAHDGSAVSGHVSNVIFPSPVSTQPEFSGDVTCLRVDGNRATVGVSLFAPGFGIGPIPSYVFIEEGITPGAPDRFAIKEAGGSGAPTTCPVPTAADLQPYVVYAGGYQFPFGPDVSQDSFVVHDHP